MGTKDAINNGNESRGRKDHHDGNGGSNLLIMNDSHKKDDCQDCNEKVISLQNSKPTTTSSSSTTTKLLLPDVFEDHFTLPLPSSTVRFRSGNTAARVFDSSTSQIVIEETLDPVRKIQVKKLKNSTKKLQFLRALYTIFCIFWTGILFAFCLQVLLTIILELAVQTGETALTSKANVWSFIGTALALFVFSRGFASAMVLSSAFVQDAWSGQFLMKKIFFTKQINEIAVDWIFFAFFILFPLLALSFSLYSKSENWWSITALFWFACVALFYVIFAFNAVCLETFGAIEYVKQQEKVNPTSTLDILKHCILLKQMHTYSGTRRIEYIARTTTTSFQSEEEGDRKRSTETDLKGEMFPDTRKEVMSVWAKLTMLKIFSRENGSIPIFKPLNPPQRVVSIDDIQGNRPFITKNTWSLERLYCRTRHARYVAVVHGPGAITPDQMQSSIFCSFIGLIWGLLIMTSFLTWLDFDTSAIIVGTIFYLVFALPNIRDNLKLMNIRKQVFTLDDEMTISVNGNTRSHKIEDNNPTAGSTLASNIIVPVTESEEIKSTECESTALNQGIYLVTDVERVSQVTDRFCWVIFVLELGFFFVYPLGTLFWTGNNFIGILFWIVASVSVFRYYIDLVVVIEETGNMNNIDNYNNNNNKSITPEEIWEKKSQLSAIIQSVSRDKSRLVWTAIMSTFGLIILCLFLGAAGSSSDPNVDVALDFIPQSEYYYPPHAGGSSSASTFKDIRYPACDLNKDVYGENATMADFAFMSIMAYHADNILEDELKTWFGDGNDEVVSEQGIIENWKNTSGYKNSPVIFRLFHFTKKDTAVISIKGTSNPWDLLADSQLWSTAALVQGLRFLLPMGEMWSPILDELVRLINLLKSDSLERVSYYKATTAFANYLKGNNQQQQSSSSSSSPPPVLFKNIQVTGHSLGGGLAIITGAQTGLPAVALSGPNARLSGSSFQPIVTYEQLNRHTFNIIPKRDPVAMFDDPADQIQKIECASAPNSPMECHYSTRSLCEILYRCGSGNRPVYCQCHAKYKYPKPTALPGARDLDEICPPITIE